MENIQQEAEREDYQKLSESMETVPFKNIRVLETLKNLLSKLENSAVSYGSVIGDDASGRIPALLIRKFINERKKGVGVGQINGYFVASGRHSNYEAIEKFLKSKKDDIGKALIVTEFIDTGDSIKRLSDVFRKLDIDFSVATVSLLSIPDHLVGNIFHGESGYVGLDEFYNKTGISGVTKYNKNQNDENAHAIKSDDLPEIANAARNDINKFVAYYIEKHPRG